MNKILIQLILCILPFMSMYAQSPEVDNLKVKNKIYFSPVNPTADNARMVARAGDLFYNSADSSLYI